MKLLSLLRHAKSDWGDPSLEDFDRPLNERGWKAARHMGSELARRGFDFDCIVASPAVRVRETISGLTKNLKRNVEVRNEPRIYAASETTLLEIVRELPETALAPLLVGHNPGLQSLIVALARDDSRHRHRVARKFPTAAFAQLELAVNRWADVERGVGEIAELIIPRELD